VIAKAFHAVAASTVKGKLREETFGRHLQKQLVAIYGVTGYILYAVEKIPV
jgi:hypothetical protein